MLKLIDPPVYDAVTAEEVLPHLRLDYDQFVEDVAYIDVLINAAISAVEEWTGRAVVQAGYELVAGGFPDRGDVIALLPPVQSVESVTYIRSDGEVVTYEDFAIVGDGIAPVSGHWPVAAPVPNAVRIRFRAGYEEVPYPLKAAILLSVGDLYENREAVSPETLHHNPTFERLLAPYRVW
jgi:uncharacterized phiE125 gp8 family phage protein